MPTASKKPTGRPRNPKRAAVLRDCVKLKRGLRWVIGPRFWRFGAYVGASGVRVAVTRTDYRYTLAEIAERHGVTEAQVSKWARAEGVTRHHTKEGK